MIYLASPYRNPSPSVRIQRFQAACAYAAKLIQKGNLVFSPIAHSHPIALTDESLIFDSWSKLDLRLLAICDDMYVLRLPGWEESEGVKAEIEFARQLGIFITYVDP